MNQQPEAIINIYSQAMIGIYSNVEYARHVLVCPFVWTLPICILPYCCLIICLEMRRCSCLWPPMLNVRLLLSWFPSLLWLLCGVMLQMRYNMTLWVVWLFNSVMFPSPCFINDEWTPWYKSTLRASLYALKYTELFCVCQGAWEPAGQHRPQHPHIERGAGGVSAVEEGARADWSGESGTPQKRQGPVETGVGHGQNWEHVRLLALSLPQTCAKVLQLLLHYFPLTLNPAI